MTYLWNIIRDFFVYHVFGGTGSSGVVWDLDVGQFYSIEGNTYENCNTASYYLPIKGFSDDSEILVDFITLGDWLSTTATIITLVGLFIAITLLIISLFKWIVRLVSLRG